MKRFAAHKILATLLLPLAFACTKKVEDVGTIRMRLPGDPPTLDWNLLTDNVSKEVISPLHEGLLAQDEGSGVVPALAESWTIDTSGKIYEFTIRENAKWSDGEPVLAQHFADGWERLLNPATASEYAYFMFDIKGAEDFQSGKNKDFAAVGVKVLSDRKLQVELRQPAAYWIHIPTFWVTHPIRKELIAKFGDKWTQPGNLVTAGPYVLKEWARESKLVLEKNPHFYDAAAIADAPNRIEFRVVKEGATAVTLFKNKEFDIVRDIPPVQVPSLSQTPEFKSNLQFRGYYVAFNLKDPHVADIKTRQAIAHSINRDELVKVLGKVVTPETSWIPHNMLAHDESLGLKYDPAKARALWAEVKNKPKNIEMWFNHGELNKLVAENLQSQLKRELGLDLVIQIQEWKTYLKTLSTATPSIFRLGWGADYPDPHNFMDLFTCKSGNNFTKFCDAAYDKGVLQAAGERDEAKRVALYSKLQKLLLENQAAVVPLFNENLLHLVSQRVTGFQPNPMGDFSFKKIRLK